jgi:iron complex transport system ATP-binding protein
MTGLEIDIASAGYRARNVLTDIALSPIPPGSLVAVIGPNAAGKSTLLKAIAGLVRAQGSARLDGEDLLRQRLGDRVRNVAYLPQSLPQPTPLVAYEAVFSAVRATRPELSKAGAEAAVERVFTDLGLRDIALRPLAEMSGGQRQMIGLAQLMARAPRLMLLDEPTSALDLHWQMDVIEAVRTATRRDGAIALLAIHDINLAIRACDSVVVIADGRLLADGPPAEVLDAGILRAAYGVEARIERCSRGTPFILIDGAVEGAAQGNRHAHV